MGETGMMIYETHAERHITKPYYRSIDLVRNVENVRRLEEAHKRVVALREMVMSPDDYLAALKRLRSEVL
jgi:hypothetical protein